LTPAPLFASICTQGAFNQPLSDRREAVNFMARFQTWLTRPQCRQIETLDLRKIPPAIPGFKGWQEDWEWVD